MNPLVGALHVHSDYSHDSIDSLEQLRDVSVQRGIAWIALTDHAEHLDQYVFDEYLGHCTSLSDDEFRFIPGLEFRFPHHRGMHLLALDVTRWMSPSTPEEFFDQAEEAAGFTVLAHPMLCRYTLPPVVEQRVDAVEVWNAKYNGRHLPDPGAIALHHAIAERRPDLLATVGLDQHDSHADGGVRIALHAGTNMALIAALHAGEFTNTGHSLAFDARAALPHGAMRSLRRRRRALDAVTSVRDRMRIAAHHLGLD